MASLDDENVRDLLFGDTDPRDLALFLAQKSLTMDPVERDQRQTILSALSTHATVQMAEATARLAAWTRAMALFTALLAVATVAVLAVESL